MRLNPKKPRNCLKISTRRSRGTSSRKRRHSYLRNSHITREISKRKNQICSSSDNVSAKLEALEILIPARDNNGESRNADQLFKETADHILRLKSQVLILQRLIGFYGSSTEGDQNAVLS